MCADEADGRLFPSVLVEQCSGLDVCQGFCCASDSTLSKKWLGWSVGVHWGLGHLPRNNCCFAEIMGI